MMMLVMEDVVALMMLDALDLRPKLVMLSVMVPMPTM